MKVLRRIATGGITVIMGLTLIGCGSSFNYTGEATVISKEKDVEYKKKSSTSKSKSKDTDYELTLDIPNTDVNQVIEVPQNRYDAIQPQQKVQLVNGKLK